MLTFTGYHVYNSGTKKHSALDEGGLNDPKYKSCRDLSDFIYLKIIVSCIYFDSEYMFGGTFPDKVKVSKLELTVFNNLFACVFFYIKHVKGMFLGNGLNAKS